MPNNSLLLSVLVLCHNEDTFLRRCLRSILAQDLSVPIEVILLDDASTDNSVAVAEAEMAAVSRSNLQFRIIRHQTNQGNAAAFVTALGAARGKYYHVLDADDYWIDPEKLAVQISILEADRTLAGVGHRTIVRNLRDGSETYVPQPEPHKTVLEFEDFLFGGWYFHTSAMMLRNPCIDPLGPVAILPAIFNDVRGDTVPRPSSRGAKFQS